MSMHTLSQDKHVVQHTLWITHLLNTSTCMVKLTCSFTQSKSWIRICMLVRCLSVIKMSPLNSDHPWIVVTLNSSCINLKTCLTVVMMFNYASKYDISFHTTKYCTCMYQYYYKWVCRNTYICICLYTHNIQLYIRKCLL